MCKYRMKQISNKRWFVVSSRVESYKSDTTNVQVIVMQSLKEITHVLSQQCINGLWL